MLRGDGINVLERDVDRHGGVVDQSVEPAPALLGGLDERQCRVGRGDVAGHVDRVGELVGQAFTGSDRARRVDDDARAASSDPAGDGLADPTA